MPTDSPPDWVLQQRQQVGRQIRDLRRDRDLSQLHLAERAGIDRKTVYRAELATHSTGVDHLLMIARALGVPAGRLFGDEE